MRAAPTIEKPGSSRFQVGQELACNLQTKALLGGGGMAKVYLARQRLWEVDVAVKAPNDKIVSDPENRHRIVGGRGVDGSRLHSHIATGDTDLVLCQGFVGSMKKRTNTPEPNSGRQYRGLFTRILARSC
jgi:hypothetical protein